MISTFVRSRLPKPSEVFQSYWYFAAERQRVFRSRLQGEGPPLTRDEVIAEFKFTNAYRASDRTSQYLIRHVIYQGARGFRDLFARVLLFKLFNRIQTWELLESALGEIDAESVYDNRAERTLEASMRRGESVYSAAYIMPSAHQFGAKRKFENHLRLLRAMLDDQLDAKLRGTGRMAEAYGLLINYPSIGPFLAYQLVTDLNYCPQLKFGEDDFVKAGPGALDGIRKCFRDPGDLSPEDIIRWTMDTQSDAFEQYGYEFSDLWGRSLQLIDCQNLFCEVDKYARVAHPEVGGLSGRSRIKHRFRPRTEELTAWYPPKWGINGRVDRWLRENRQPAVVTE